MSKIFLSIINMSISASYIVIAVLLLRLLLKKAPKWIAVFLWGIVAVRLVCPFSIESVLSLIPSSEVVSPNIMTDNTPTINTGIPIINSTLNPVISESFTPDPGASANPLQIWIPILTATWIVGIVALLIYTVISYAKVKRKIGTAVLYKDNIYQSEHVVSPFVLGIIKPKIYLPFNMNEKDMEHVVAHEMAHIRRKDHLWKPLGFLLLTIHWFNPLMWLGYVLLCRDIELACDEKVIGELDHDARADYSEALLTCSVNRKMIAACPLAFGEVGVKDRVKSVLNYKKPAFWIIIAAVVACVVLAVCFLTDPKLKSYGETDPNKLNETQISLMSRYPEYFGLDSSKGLDVYVWQMAEHHYSFGILPHSKQMRDWLSDDLVNLKGVSAENMREILATYDIDEEDIYVLPWQNPISSYIGEYWIITEGEDIDAKRNAYVESIRAMLFETVPKQNFMYAFLLDDGRQLCLNIQEFGCDVKDAKIDFEKARFEDGQLIFDIHWTNEGADNIDIGPDFEVYRYNGSTPQKLEQLGYWDLYCEMLAGKGMNVAGEDSIILGYEKATSYNISAHYDILAPGKYRFEAHGAWVEFQIISDLSYFSVVYDTSTFDIDGDGKDERCSLRHGTTSGLFTFIFLVQDKETGEVEYESRFYSQVYELSFEKDSDGITRVKAITRDETPVTHIFDISIKDGYINLTENGVPIGEIKDTTTLEPSLLYFNPTLSWVLDPDNVPTVDIMDGKLYKVDMLSNDMLSLIEIGYVAETTTEQNDFKTLKESYGGKYGDLVTQILSNNKKIYRVNPHDKQGVTLYYVMYQNDGSTILVYGHYAGGQKNDFIRWIFQHG